MPSAQILELPAARAVLAPAASRRALGAGWRVIGLFWLAALGCIGLTASNFYAVSQAAGRIEEAARQAPYNHQGRGACAEFARTQPPMMFDPDSECWINLAQKQFRDGTIRPHDFTFDNTPYGRERHWSSSFSWWLLLLGAITHVVTGTPMEMAIARAAAWANPVLFAVFLTALALVLRRRVNAWTAGAFILTLAAMAGVEWDFSYGRPDHHGLHLMAFTSLFLGALIGGMGWVRSNDDTEAPPSSQLVPRTAPTWEHACTWFTVSGVAGGAGLWIGSTQQIFCVGALGAGAVLGALCFARKCVPGETSRFEPELWRYWCRLGAATSLGFYLLEYFPFHLEMRPEVNHPLIALAWLGAGELMWLLTMAKIDWPGGRPPGRALLGRAALGSAAMAALPLAILFGPARWFVLANPMLRWAAKVISEGEPWFDPAQPAVALHKIWAYTGVFLLAMPLAVGVLIWRRPAPARCAALLTLLFSTGVFLAWTIVQSRWIGFLEVSTALLALVAAPCLSFLPLPLGGRAGNRAAAFPLTLLILSVPGWLGFGAVQLRTHADNPDSHAAALLEGMMCTKEAAWNLRLYAPPGRPARVMAPPGPSPTLHYYGGVETVGSYYWENIAGCQATLEFFTDTGDAAARRIARERDLDFVVVVVDPGFVLELQLIRTGRMDVAAARKMLAFRLSNPAMAGAPDWLEPLPLLDAPMAQAEGIRIYRVRKDRL